jgi:lipoyl(octanoyl) transferase
MPPCRLLIDPAGVGTWNMAADDVLLDAAGAGVAALRYYQWAAPTLSLGYFQPSFAARSFPDLAWLRRVTGGDAIVHHHELTYSLALPAGSEFQPRSVIWMTRFHELIRDALRRFGVVAELCEREQRHGDVLCFLHHTPGDLIVAGHKVAGSAQRKQSGTLLQHGSILLHQSVHTPALPGIAELTGRPVSPEDLREALIAGFRRETGWALEERGFDERERGLIADRIASRYGAAAWNEKR